jgi:hypothetical protein
VLAFLFLVAALSVSTWLPILICLSNTTASTLALACHNMRIAGLSYGCNIASDQQPSGFHFPSSFYDPQYVNQFGKFLKIKRIPLFSPLI